MNSSNIIIGPGYTTWNGGTFRFAEGGMKTKFIKNFREVTAEEFGRFDSAQTHRMIETTGRLWSGWENIPIIMPASAFTPVIGGKLFGVASLPLVNNGQDGSRFTGFNTQLVQMANLMLSVEKELFAADVKFLSLLRPGFTPDQASAYYSYSPNNAYAAPQFNRANFRAPVLAAAWPAVLTNGGGSFAAFSFKNGAAINWKWDIDISPGDNNPCFVDGYGLVDAIINGFEGTEKGTPIGPTEADVAAALFPQQALGLLEGTNGAADLTNTFGANSLVLKQAFISEHDGFAWSRKANRIGDLTWRTTVPFTNGAPTARASAS